eukprot:286807-Lingulodinium_polyedra.AAC.1
MAAAARHWPHVWLLDDPFDHTKQVLYHELTGEKAEVSAACTLNFQDSWGYLSEGSSSTWIKDMDVFKLKCFVVGGRYYYQAANGDVAWCDKVQDEHHFALINDKYPVTKFTHAIDGAYQFWHLSWVQ